VHSVARSNASTAVHHIECRTGWKRALMIAHIRDFWRCFGRYHSVLEGVVMDARSGCIRTRISKQR